MIRERSFNSVGSRFTFLQQGIKFMFEHLLRDKSFLYAQYMWMHLLIYIVFLTDYSYSTHKTESSICYKILQKKFKKKHMHAKS